MKGNKVVLLLPLSVMAGLFLFGYLTLNETEDITNENMQSDVELSVNKSEGTATIQWKWPGFPDDGVRGDDFLEIIMAGNDAASVEGIVSDVKLELYQAGDTLYSHDDWYPTEKGIAVAFPNEAEDETVAGSSGQLTVDFTEEYNGEEIQVDYFHTWQDHQVNLDHENSEPEALLKEEGVTEYWVISNSN